MVSIAPKPPVNKLTLSGKNTIRSRREVHLNAKHIGYVLPSTPSLWEAVDLTGNSHGKSWLTSWDAAHVLQQVANYPKSN